MYCVLNLLLNWKLTLTWRSPTFILLYTLLAFYPEYSSCFQILHSALFRSNFFKISICIFSRRQARRLDYKMKYILQKSHPSKCKRHVFKSTNILVKNQDHGEASTYHPPLAFSKQTCLRQGVEQDFDIFHSTSYERPVATWKIPGAFDTPDRSLVNSTS